MSLSIIDRTVGVYPISIGTSLAIEGLTHTGEFDKEKGAPPIKECGMLYINIRTLFRNAFGSYDDLKDRLTADIMIETLINDINEIKEAVKASSPSTVCVVYLCRYKQLNKIFKEAKFKNPNTANQIFYNALEHDAYLECDKDTYGEIKYFDTELKGDVDTFIITHMPIDLLSHKRFPSLTLLESHTGKVKNKMLWYTKLNGKRPDIPFNRAFIQIFGDGVTFSPQAIKVRRVIQSCAEKNRWHQNTSSERIILNLRTTNEPHVLDFFKKLSKS